MFKQGSLNSFLPHTLTLLCMLVTVLSSINITTPCNSSELANEEDKKIYLILMLPFSETIDNDGTILNTLRLLGTQPILSVSHDLGHDIAPAAYAAVQDINNRSDLLEGYTLDLVRSHGGCNIIERTVVGFAREVFHSDLPLFGMVGPWCSDSSTTIAQLTSYEDGVSLVSLHFGTVASLGNRKKYNNMFGMFGPTELWTGAYVELMKHNSWTNVSILFSETNVYHIERAIELKNAFKKANVLKTPDYRLHTFPVYETFFPINDIKKAFTRVIFVFAAPRLSRELLCVAYHEGLKYPYYQFVFASRQESDFGETRLFYDGKHYNCSVEEMQTALRGHLNFFLSLNSEPSNLPTDTGLTYEQFESKYDDTVEWYREHFNVSSNSIYWASPAYDAVWALSLALNNSLDELRERNLSLLEATKGNRQEITTAVQKNIVHVDFQGVSGHIQFNEANGFIDRNLSLFRYSVNQLPTKVGYYESGSLTINAMLTDTENSSEPIFISSTFMEHNTQLSLSVAVPILVLTILIVFIGLPFHLINIVYRNHHVIKATSSQLNHLIFTGGYIIVFGIVILTLSNTLELSYNTQIALCNISPFLTSIGLTLILGTVCLRTWRLYEIFVKWDMTRKSSILLQDYTLLVFVLLLALVDVFVCVLWSTIDTRKPDNTTTIVTVKNEPLPIAVTNTHCHTKNDTWWVAAIILHKCVILAFSLFFAYLTRKVNKLKTDFQTRNITLLVYAFAVIFGIGFPTYVVTEIVSEHEVVSFLIYCAFMDIAVCTSFLFLFLSSVLKLYRKLNGTVNTV